METLLVPYFESEKLIHELNAQGKDGPRSSKVTDILNGELVNILKSKIPESYKFETEVSIRCARGDKFKVDIAIKDSDGRLAGVVLLKAIRSSYNKNRHNYGNTVCGEFSRLFTFEEKTRKDLQVLMVDWVPYQIPVFDKHGNLKNMEQTKIPSQTGFVKFVNEQLKKVNSSFSIAKIRFDLQKPTHATGGDEIDNFCSRFV